MIKSLKLKKTKKAFTLIEILVVLGIIGVILGLGFASYSSAQKKARDAKRASDINQIQNAFEQYYSICNYVYPVDDTGGLPKAVPTSIICDENSNIIMRNVPLDPLGNQYQVVAADTSKSTYTICPPPVRDIGNNNYRTEIGDCKYPDNPFCCASNQQ